jgi:hypothetical protein
VAASQRTERSVSLPGSPHAALQGNTHFPFSDLSNPEVADLMFSFLQKKQLD